MRRLRVWNVLTRKENSMSTVKVTDESFEKDVLQAAGPVLVEIGRAHV